MKRFASLLLAAVLALGALAGCGSKPEDVYRNPSAHPRPEELERVTLKLGMLPIVDSLPFWVAEAEGYFESQNLDVELITFKSANERDAALMSGRIDGMLADLVASATLRDSGTPVQIASLSLGATPDEGPMGILAGKGTGITDLSQLKGKEIAISTNTVMHYVAEQLLLENGFKPEEIKFVNFPSIPVRYESLMEGKINAAILPDPLLSMAEGQGAKLLATDAKAQQNYSQSVIVFTEEALQEKADGIRRLFIAYNQAIVALKLDHNRYVDLLIEKAKLPVLIKAVYHDAMPFSPAQPPREEDVERVVKWLLDKGLLKAEVTYEELVNTSVLPQS